MLQVRVTPRKAKPIIKKVVQKRSAAEYPSTNISSPIRAPSKRNIREFAYEGSSAQGPKSRQRRPNNQDRYADNDFVVPDDDEDDEDFAPIRIAKPLVSKRGKPAGRPITIDERIADLDDLQKAVLDEFMVEAKSMAQKIVVDRGLRNQPFSDTILREMGLDLPRNEAELNAIPGINPDMVKIHGKKFLALVKRARDVYGPNIPPKRTQVSRRRPVRQYSDNDDDDDDDDDDEQTPLDPNHQVVVDLCTSEESVAEEEESNYSVEEAEEEYEDDDALHVSHHFVSAPTDPRVEEYNRRCSQLEAQSYKAPPLPKPRTLPFERNRGGRRKSAGPYKKAYSGVKKGATKKTGSKRASGGAGTTKRGGGGGRGGGSGSGSRTNPWGGIMAMPT
jgi:bloom syndrome protein